MSKRFLMRSRRKVARKVERLCAFVPFRPFALNSGQKPFKLNGVLDGDGEVLLRKRPTRFVVSAKAFQYRRFGAARHNRAPINRSGR